MSAKHPLPRKVRWALALVIVMVIAAPLLAVRSYVAGIESDRLIAGGGIPDERLVSVGGHTMILQPGTLGSEIAGWLDTGNDKTLNFELGDQTFAEGSAEPSRIGANRLVQFVQLMKTHPTLKAQILLPMQAPSVEVRELEQSRAERLRDELEHRGIDPSRVTIGTAQPDQATAKGQQLAVLLTK